MKSKSYQFVFMALLPALLLALSPMKTMVCAQEMESCPPCCHEMSIKKSPSEVQVSSLNDCCIFHASEGFTAIIVLQKTEDFSKKKFYSLGFAAPSLDTYAPQNLTKSDVFPFYPFAFPTRPPLIFIKSSFLI